MTTKVPRQQQASDRRSDACCWPVVGRETKKLKSRQCRPECPDITASVCSHQPPRAHEGNQPPGAGANNTATLPLRDNNGGTEPLLADVVKSPRKRGGPSSCRERRPLQGPTLSTIQKSWVLDISFFAFQKNAIRNFTSRPKSES